MTTTIAIGVFPGLTLLDVIGPYQVLALLPDADVVVCAAERGRLTDDKGLVHLDVERTFDDVPEPDVLLEGFGATYSPGRVSIDGKYLTGAGVSAGIDLALQLAAQLRGDDVARAIQLGIEYDPQPPFDAGSPATAGPAIVEMARAASEARRRP